MSRELFLSLDMDQVTARCLEADVGISAAERLPAGGVRLVCNSSEGAQRMRTKLKKQLINAQDVRRELHRPRSPLW